MAIDRIRRAMLEDASKRIDASGIANGTVTNEEFEALNGVTGNIQAQFANKQNLLRSGSNIKTINGQSILGSGDLVIDGGQTEWGDIGGNIINQTDLVLALNAKQNLLVNQVNIKSINGISLLGSGDIVIAGGGGTVTSVAMTVPTGLTVTGSPITTSGTLAVALQSGYSIPTTTSQSNWDVAYLSRISSLTVTGSSGSATLFGNVLNIPTYTLAGLGYTVPTLAQVTTAGNTTTNAITVGNINANGQITTRGATLPSFAGNGSIVVGGTNIGASIGVLLGVQIPYVSGAFGGHFIGYSNQVNPKWLIGISRNVSQENSLVYYEDSAAANPRFAIHPGGNVTIGTITDAGYKLDVNGTARIQGALTATLGSATTANVIYYNTSTGLFTYGAPAATPTLAQVTTAGNTTTNSITVGNTTIQNNYPYLLIKNTSPTSPDVGIIGSVQSIAGGGGGGYGMLGIMSYNPSMQFFLSGTAGVKAELSDVLNSGSWNRTLTIRGTYPVFTFNSADAKWAAIGYDYSGGMAFWVNASSADTAAINPSVYLNNAGNLGVGTYSPTTRLQVVGSTDVPFEVTRSANLNSGIKFSNTGVNYSVLYGGSSGYALRYFYNASEFLTVSTSGNLGVGTSSPTEKLQVAGAAILNATLTINADGGGNSTNSRIYLKSTDNVRGAGVFTNGIDATWFMGNPYLNYSTAFIIGRYGAATPYDAAAGISEALLTIRSTGNIGIGTNSPQNYGSGYRVLHIGNATGASGLIKLTTGTSLDGPEIYTDASNNLFLNTNGAFNRFFISGSTGNVGIGTTTPSASYKLDVNGDAKARFWDAHDASSITGFRLFGAGTFMGGLGLGAWSGTSGAATNDIVQVLASGVNYHIGAGGAVKLTVANNGNVGIGFNAASTRLGIVGGASVWNETTPGQTVGTVHLSAGNNTDQVGNALTFGAIDYLPTTTAQAGIYVKASGSYGTKMYFATTQSFAVGSRTRMMIDNNGRIGINTTSPASLLNVNVGGSNANGTAGITVGGTGNYLSLEFGIEGGYDGMIRTYGNDLLLYSGHWRTVGTVSTENHNIKFYTSQAGSSNWSTPKMFLNHLGNLGIGTTSPSYKLQVEGTTYINSYVTVTDGTTGADMYADSIYGRGAMGLGSTIQPSGSNRHLRILTPTDGGAGQISIGYFKAGVGLAWNRALNISTAPAVPHLMLQPDSGNVVIGTTIDAGYKLNVNGDINSTAYFINGVAGYTGMLVIPTNPPGQQNIDIQGGIIVNIF
jgi:hypothetical protein